MSDAPFHRSQRGEAGLESMSCVPLDDRAAALVLLESFWSCHEARHCTVNLGKAGAPCSTHHSSPARLEFPSREFTLDPEPAFRIPDYVSWSITTASRALRGTRCPIEPSPKY